MVTFITGVLTGFFAVAMSKSVSLLISWKLNFIQNTIMPTPLCSKVGDVPAPLYMNGTAMPEEACVDSCGHCILIGFLFFCLYGSVLVTIATSMVRG